MAVQHLKLCQYGGTESKVVPLWPYSLDNFATMAVQPPKFGHSGGSFEAALVDCRDRPYVGASALLRVKYDPLAISGIDP